MPTNIILPSTTDLTLDLSLKSATKRTMAVQLTTSDPGGGAPVDTDEVKVFECDRHEDDDVEENIDRLSPVIKDEESSSHPHHTTSVNPMDRLNSEAPFHNFFPYLISPYYHAAHPMANFDKMASLESLSKFMSPPPAHMANSTLGMNQVTGVSNSIYPLPSPTSFPSPYAQHWRPPVFPFALPPGYPLPSNSPSHSIPSAQKRSAHPRRFIEQHSQLSPPKQSVSHELHKSKKSHIKKPLNAFMLFMKEQRAQVVQECTLRESAAINQILGRKWHELDRAVQQKYYDMARDERMRHMQLYPGWSARDNYGARKKRGSKGKRREKNTSESAEECLNQKKCRARFGLDQQANWCKHCKRKKKCLRYTENETNSSLGVASWSDEDDTDDNDDSDGCDVIAIGAEKNASAHAGMSMDSDEENRSRLLKHQQTSGQRAFVNSRSEQLPARRDASFPPAFFQPSHHYPYFDAFHPGPSAANASEFKEEV